MATQSSPPRSPVPQATAEPRPRKGLTSEEYRTALFGDVDYQRDGPPIIGPPSRGFFLDHFYGCFTALWIATTTFVLYTCGVNAAMIWGIAVPVALLAGWENGRKTGRQETERRCMEDRDLNKWIREKPHSRGQLLRTRLSDGSDTVF